MQKYGVVDIGSNTIRLCLYTEKRAGRFKEIANMKVTARLRGYFDQAGNLSSDGIKLLIKALTSFEDIIKHHQVNKVIAVATAAIRQAKNRDEVLQLIRQQTDINVRLLSEDEEAYFGLLAVLNSTSFTEGITVDIGGGSTEVTYFHNRNLVHSHSFPFGSLSLKQRFIKGKTPTDQELHHLQAFLAEQISSLPWLKGRKVPIIGIGGSARNMGKVDQAMCQYPLDGLHLYEMNSARIEMVLAHLRPLSFDLLQKVEGLSKERADTIIPALEVFNILMFTVQAPTFIISRKGLRDGLFLEEVMRSYETSIYPNVIEEGLFELANDYEIDQEHVLHVTKVAAMILKELEKNDVVHYKSQEVKDMKRAAHVFYLGEYINGESASQHTFYLLANKELDGLSHRDRLKLALIASFKSKSTFKQYIKPFREWFTPEEQSICMLSGAILKLAYGLHSSKRDLVESILIDQTRTGLFMEITCKADWFADAEQALKQAKHLEKALKHPIEIVFRASDC